MGIIVDYVMRKFYVFTIRIRARKAVTEKFYIFNLRYRGFVHTVLFLDAFI